VPSLRQGSFPICQCQLPWCDGVLILIIFLLLLITFILAVTSSQSQTQSCDVGALGKERRLRESNCCKDFRANMRHLTTACGVDQVVWLCDRAEDIHDDPEDSPVLKAEYGLQIQGAALQCTSHHHEILHRRTDLSDSLYGVCLADPLWEAVNTNLKWLKCCSKLLLLLFGLRVCFFRHLAACAQQSLVRRFPQILQVFIFFFHRLLFFFHRLLHGTSVLPIARNLAVLLVFFKLWST